MTKENKKENFYSRLMCFTVLSLIASFLPSSSSFFYCFLLVYFSDVPFPRNGIVGSNEKQAKRFHNHHVPPFLGEGTLFSPGW